MEYCALIQAMIKNKNQIEKHLYSLIYNFLFLINQKFHFISTMVHDQVLDEFYEQSLV